MCRFAIAEAADVVLGHGSDRNRDAQDKKIGNQTFAFLLGLLSGRRVTDTASGMR